MTRSANTTPPHAPGIVVPFQRHEYFTLKFNTPGPSGLMGGYQGMENWLVEHTDRRSFRCKLPPDKYERLTRYIKNYGPGGPNKRMRAACIPALRRIGIDLLPEWAA